MSMSPSGGTTRDFMFGRPPLDGQKQTCATCKGKGVLRGFWRGSHAEGYCARCRGVGFTALHPAPTETAE